MRVEESPGAPAPKKPRKPKKAPKKRERFGLADLKLLVDIAWENRFGQRDFYLPANFGAAANRLKRAGLLVEEPGIGTKLVLTEEGELDVEVFEDFLDDEGQKALRKAGR